MPYIWGLPSCSAIICAGGPSSIPGLGISPGEGNGNPFQYSFFFPVFLTGESHRLRSLADYNPQSSRRVGHELVTKQQCHIYNIHIYTHTHIYITAQRAAVHEGCKELDTTEELNNNILYKITEIHYLRHYSIIVSTTVVTIKRL